MYSRRLVAGLLFVLISFCGSTAFGQANPVSLSDYVNAALKNNPMVGSAAQTKRSAEFTSEGIRKGYYPQIGIASHLIVPPGYDPAITNGGEFGAQITGSYMLYDGGAKSLEESKGNVGVEQGSLGEKLTRADIVYSVSNAYVAAVKQKRELRIVEREYSLLADYLQLIKQLHAAGQGSETDLLKTTVDLNNALIDINSRKVAYRNALLSLAQVAGLPSSEVTSVDSVMPAIEFDTTFNLSQNVDLESQRLVLKQAQLDAQLAGSKLRPTVSLAADAGALTSLPTIEQGLANVFGASVGISVSVPVFTFGSLHDNYSAAQASANSIALQNKYSESVLEREFEATVNEIAQADSEIAALQRNLVIAQENMVLSKAQYAGGSGLSLDVLNAIQMVNQIRLSIEDTKASREMSILKLNRLNYSGANLE